MSISLWVSLKLSEHFIETNLNDEFMYRFEIVDNKPRGVLVSFRIDEVNFREWVLVRAVPGVCPGV